MSKSESVVAGQSPPSLRDCAPRIYRAIVRARQFDDIALALQRQGGISGYAPARGQEAAQIGAVIDCGPEDMVFPSYRQPGVALERGVRGEDLLRFHTRESSCPWDWRALRFAPYTIPVGSQLPHATGWAMADKKANRRAVTIVFFGDGSSSEGEVHEAMNIASVFKAPVIFFCENNGYAISAPFARQTGAASLYVRALGYGIHGTRVDGNDIGAVRDAVAEARTRALAGLGPTLIEAVTYRLGPHTTSDDPGLYRSAEEEAMWQGRDPVTQFRAKVLAQDWATEAELHSIESEVNGEMQGVVDAHLARVSGSEG